MIEQTAILNVAVNVGARKKAKHLGKIEGSND
jgi:hypothetical protein